MLDSKNNHVTLWHELDRRRFIKVAGLGFGALAASGALIGLAGCSQKEDASGVFAGHINDSPNATMAAFRNRFADFEPYRFEGRVKHADGQTQTDLQTTENYRQFVGDNASDFYYWRRTILSEPAQQHLSANGFVVSDAASWAEHFGVYERNRYSSAPSFITSDSVLHTFHLMFDFVLTRLEENHLISILTQLSDSMLQASLDQFQMLQGTDFYVAAIRNIAYFAVGSSILGGSLVVPDGAPSEVANLVEAELMNIDAKGIAASAVINFGQVQSSLELELIDYSQFVPRSHYNKTAALQAYFMASKWYGQATFRSAYDEELRSALLICHALKQGQNEELFYRIFESINFFVGECDDITCFQYEQATIDIYGEGSIADLSIVSDPDLFSEAAACIRELAPPQINSLPIYEEEVQPDAEAAITGFRFLGERFTIDAAIFQKLIDRSVRHRMLPTFLDIPAAFGSAKALELLKETGVPDEYPDYSPRMAEAREYFDAVDEDTWTSNLYWAWLYTLRPLLELPGGAKSWEGETFENLPGFMQVPVWQNKQLNCFAGSWSELKRDTLLYSKQPMAEMGAGGPNEPPPDDRGYVEPVPDVFGRLASLVQMTIDGLTARNILPEEAAGSLETLKYLAVGCTTIAEKELTGQAISNEEYEFIKTFGAELEHIWYTAKQDELQGNPASVYLGDHPCAIVADVATDPNGFVLEQATGYAKEIYVIFPRDGKAVIGCGAAFSHYEFIVPLAERLTDEAWHIRLKEGDIPEFEDWKKAFIVNIGDGSWARV